MSIRKIAVLSMLVVMLIAFNVPASFAQSVGKAGTNAAATGAALAKTANLGANAAAPLAAGTVAAAAAPAVAPGFGGYGFPFNWGFASFGVGGFPFNWGLGGGWGPFPLLRWNRFSPGFWGSCGAFPFSPCFAGCFQPMPFILGSELGCAPVLGWDVSSWAFGLQSCVRSLPLYFGAHGFGFPFSLGNFRIGLTPCCC